MKKSPTDIRAKLKRIIKFNRSIKIVKAFLYKTQIALLTSQKSIMIYDFRINALSKTYSLSFQPVDMCMNSIQIYVLKKKKGIIEIINKVNSSIQKIHYFEPTCMNLIEPMKEGHYCFISDIGMFHFYIERGLNISLKNYCIVRGDDIKQIECVPITNNVYLRANSKICKIHISEEEGAISISSIFNVKAINIKISGNILFAIQKGGYQLLLIDTITCRFINKFNTASALQLIVPFTSGGDCLLLGSLYFFFLKHLLKRPYYYNMYEQIFIVGGYLIDNESLIIVETNSISLMDLDEVLSK